jgi:hypothetical protein
LKDQLLGGVNLSQIVLTDGLVVFNLMIEEKGRL